jgi:N-carbamoylputrescine amidase
VKAALIVNTFLPDAETNLRRMTESAGADFALFPEAAPTGLINNDDPAHDLPLGQPIPGPATDRLGAAARERGIHVAFGLLERDGDALYDSAVLLNPDGEIALRYRRIQPQWHGRNADPDVYRQGDELPLADTPFGRTVVLICGDLFDDDIAERARAREPDLLLFPFSRNFGDGTIDQDRWDRDEEPEYAARAARVGATTLMVNELGDPAVCEWPGFGGAWGVSPDGAVTSRWPLGTPGMLIAEL